MTKELKTWKNKLSICVIAIFLQSGDLKETQNQSLEYLPLDSMCSYLNLVEAKYEESYCKENIIIIPYFNNIDSEVALYRFCSNAVNMRRYLLAKNKNEYQIFDMIDFIHDYQQLQSHYNNKFNDSLSDHFSELLDISWSNKYWTGQGSGMIGKMTNRDGKDSLIFYDEVKKGVYTKKFSFN